VARRLGRDSLARVAARAIPVCYYRQAEAAVAADSARWERNARLFEQVAMRWPDYALAPIAQYRAGLGYAKAGRHRDALRAMQGLVEHFPRSPFVRDAHLEIARAWEGLGEKTEAAQAYVAFARAYPDDESAGGAYLKAADLEAAAGEGAQADELRLTYIRKYPGDYETAMSVLEGMATRELDTLGTERPISSLLPAPPRVTKTGARKAAAAPALPPPSRLATYLRYAAGHPDVASHGLLARVRFLQGEEAYAAYGRARLTQPLTRSIPVKKRLLDTLLVRYRRCVDLGVPERAHAAAFRIGSALVEFADALQRSERPADLHGDDLLAYEDVLAEQGRAFEERGEGVWSDLVRQQRVSKAHDDDWIAQAQARLWQRLASRFLYEPEAEFPLVRGAAPPERDAPAGAERGGTPARDSSQGNRALSNREGPGR
jgi:tetratricopeptide (TPR) repeat protein